MKIEEIVADSEDCQYIRFDDGSILSSVHERDCCEEVYADFRNMQVMMPMDKNFVWARELDFYEDILNSIVKVPGVGFYIVTKQGICILVSCYNDNNGYYSNDLALRHRGATLDIVECTYDVGFGDIPEFAEELKKNGFRATGEFGGVYRRELEKINMEIEVLEKMYGMIYGVGGCVDKIYDYSKKAKGMVSEWHEESREKLKKEKKRIMEEREMMEKKRMTEESE